MVVEIEVFPGEYRKSHMEPVCGQDFCSDCQACLACDMEPCDDGGGHRWVIGADELLLDARAIRACGLGVA